jgi:hypothetical protein
MAKLLLKEVKANDAVEILITGIDEANRLYKRGVPKALTKDLRNALKVAGFPVRGLAEEITSVCIDKGPDAASLFLKNARED